MLLLRVTQAIRDLLSMSVEFSIDGN